MSANFTDIQKRTIMDIIAEAECASADLTQALNCLLIYQSDTDSLFHLANLAESHGVGFATSVKSHLMRSSYLLEAILDIFGRAEKTLDSGIKLAYDACKPQA